MNFKKNKKRSSIQKRSLLSFAITLILLFYAWIAEALYSVHLPDAQHAVQLYSTEMQDDLSLTMSKAIEEAKSSVTLIIYALSDPRIINSLKHKANSGVLVRVIVDAKTSPHVEKKLGPNVKLLKRYITDLTHDKLLVIDDKQVWVGSANMTRESLRHHGNLMVAIESEPLAAMVSAKARTLTSTERMQRLTHRSFPLGKQSVELWLLPDDPMALGRLKELIKSAQKCIRIAMFTWTRHDLAQEVIAANKRGIEVEVVLDRSSAMGASSKIARLLAEAGIHVKLSNGGALLHHKLMIVDQEMLINGSANWTLKAFEKNDDCFIVLHPLSEEQREFLDAMWHIIDHDSSPLESWQKD